MFGVAWDYYSSKLKGKQYKQNISTKSYKTEIKILANPGLAKSGFEQPGPGVFELCELFSNECTLKKKLLDFYDNKSLFLWYSRPWGCLYNLF